MTDSLLQMGLSNACLSLALAIVAMVVGATTRRPHLAHMLWLLVFVKLVTPPIVTIPVLTIPQQPETVVAINDHSQPPPLAGVLESGVSPPAPPVGEHQSDVSRSGLSPTSGHEPDVSRSGPPPGGNRELDVHERPAASLAASIGAVAFRHGKTWLPPIWLLGSVVVFVWSLVRVYRFGRLLTAESEIAPQPLQAAAERMARRLGLKNIPTICTTSARISPMVWWAGGKVQIVVPTTMLDQMEEKQWQWILAHELAHVRRRDYLVRWIEWLACVGFWWNPVVWWAQRNLRAAEEICCDALVLSSLNPQPRSYAKSILTAVESLARPAIRPPAMASEINSGGFLERRFRMIVSETPNRVTSRWLQACILLCAAAVLPIGMAYAQDYEAVGKRLREAVQEGELTGEQARAMMGALKKASGDTKDQKPDRARQYLMKLRKELGAAVEAGKISREDAAKKYEAVEKAVKKKMAAGRGQSERGENDAGKDDWVDKWIKSLSDPLVEAVKAGKLSEEEALAKWQIIKEKKIAPKLKGAVKGGHLSEDKAWAVWRGIEKAEAAVRLKAAVEAGKISKEEAWAKWAEINKADDKKHEPKKEPGKTDAGKEDGLEAVGEHLKAIGDRLRAAVAADKLSEEEAWAKWREVKVEIIKEATESGKISQKEAGELWRAIEKMEIAAKLGKAVEKGEITEEEAKAKWAQINKKGDHDDGIENWLESVGERLKGAVKAGKLSEEEAWAKWRQIKEKELAPKLKAAVRAGTMSEEKAWGIWHAVEKAEAAERIKAALAKGEISEEEAKAKWAEIMKKTGDKK